MKRFIYRFLFCLQIHHLLRFLLKKKTIILLYHGLTNQDHHDGIENYDAKHLHVERFKFQMQYLKKYYHVIPLGEWLEYRATGSKLPSNLAVITFDDGYYSNYEFAFPILNSLGLPATIFLTTDFIEHKHPLWVDAVEYAVSHARCNVSESKILYAAKFKSMVKRLPPDSQPAAVRELEDKMGVRLSEAEQPPKIYQPLQWKEIGEMLKSRIITFGSHTHTHAILSRYSDANLLEELSLSKKMIEDRTGDSCKLFCYPNGEEGDFNQQTKKALQDTGYLCGLTSVEGFNDALSDAFELRRMGVSNHADEMDFVMTLVGVKTWLSNVKKGFLKLIRKKAETPLHGTRQHPPSSQPYKLVQRYGSFFSR